MTVELLPTVPIFDVLWPIALAVCPRSDGEQHDYGERLRRQALRWDTFDGLRRRIYTHAQSGDIRLFDARRVPVEGPAFGLSVLAEDLDRLDRAFGIASRVAEAAPCNRVDSWKEGTANQHGPTSAEAPQLFRRRTPLSSLIEQAIAGKALPLTARTLKQSVVAFLQNSGVAVEHIDESQPGRRGTAADRQVKFCWEGKIVIRSDKQWSDLARHLNQVACEAPE